MPCYDCGYGVSRQVEELGGTSRVSDVLRTHYGIASSGSTMGEEIVSGELVV